MKCLRQGAEAARFLAEQLAHVAGEPVGSLPAPVLALARERELTPKDVLTDLFEEELLPNSEAMAEIVIQRLIDAGFVIEPAEN
jgi:hypothetical protein